MGPCGQRAEGQTHTPRGSVVVRRGCRAAKPGGCGRGWRQRPWEEGGSWSPGRPHPPPGCAPGEKSSSPHPASGRMRQETTAAAFRTLPRSPPQSLLPWLQELVVFSSLLRFVFSVSTKLPSLCELPPSRTWTRRAAPRGMGRSVRGQRGLGPRGPSGLLLRPGLSLQLSRLRPRAPRQGQLNSQMDGSP